jgi:hypothetical protein
MGGLFGGKPKTPEMPKVKVERMPVAEDPNADQAAARFRDAAAARRGRRSTIMTDALKEMTGSSGQRLGN